MTDTTALRAIAERAQERVGGISIKRMQGDNLAVTLCSHFDDGEGEQENGWTEAATAGYEETIAAIRQHYQAAFDALLDHIDAQARALEEVEAVLRVGEVFLDKCNSAWSYRVKIMLRAADDFQNALNTLDTTARTASQSLARQEGVEG